MLFLIKYLSEQHTICVFLFLYMAQTVEKTLDIVRCIDWIFIMNIIFVTFCGHLGIGRKRCISFFSFDKYFFH